MGRRILIAEDELISALAMEAHLHKYGYETTTLATTGEETIEIAGKENPDLVLMDISLSGAMNGIQAARVIYQQFNIHSIYVSGYSKEQMLAQIQGEESAGYLGKPYAPNELKAVIEEALSHKSADFPGITSGQSAIARSEYDASGEPKKLDHS